MKLWYTIHIPYPLDCTYDFEDKRDVSAPPSFLAEESAKVLEDRRVINALSFERRALVKDEPYKSCLAAFDATVSCEGAVESWPYPVSDTLWVIAATEGANHRVHFDTNGVWTIVECRSGSKYWCVAGPKNKPNVSSHHRQARCWASTGTVGDYVHLDSVKPEDGQFGVWEGILLQPRSKL